MKTAFRNYDECAREWVRRCIAAPAAGVIGEGHAGGKVGQRWRMSFNMCSIYSYGHWTMAVFVIDQRYFLVRTDTYSSTTSTHQRAARNAIASSGLEYIALPYDWWVNPGSLGPRLREHNDALLHMAVHARAKWKKERYIEQAAAMCAQVERYQQLTQRGAK